MLMSAKKGSYVYYKKHWNLFQKFIDDYRLLKNVYFSRYGNDDIDVLGISLIKIDDILDNYLKMTYISNPMGKNVMKRLTEG